MMRNWMSPLFVFLGLMVFGCMGYADQEVIGSKYSYKIPGNYIDSGSFMPSFGEARFDKSKSLSISFETEDLSYFDGLETASISIIVFLDREYDHLLSLKSEGNRIISESERVPCSDWAACYKRTIAGLRTNYYFTFDPEIDGPALVEPEDYILSVLPAHSPIEGVKTRGVDTCSYYRVLDGMLLKVSASGESCSSDKSDILTSGITAIFDDWRVEA